MRSIKDFRKIKTKVIVNYCITKNSKCNHRFWKWSEVKRKPGLQSAEEKTCEYHDHDHQMIMSAFTLPRIGWRHEIYVLIGQSTDALFQSRKTENIYIYFWRLCCTRFFEGMLTWRAYKISYQTKINKQFISSVHWPIQAQFFFFTHFVCWTKLNWALCMLICLRSSSGGEKRRYSINKIEIKASDQLEVIHELFTLKVLRFTHYMKAEKLGVGASLWCNRKRLDKQMYDKFTTKYRGVRE